jgi:hypothetical protein
MNKKVVILFLFFLISLSVFPDELVKKYYNNIFGGGKERIVFSNESDRKNVNILKSYIIIDLYDDYASVNITYSIKSNDNSKIRFMYPKIDTLISKNIYSLADKKQEEIITKNMEYKLEGSYNDFKVLINNKSGTFNIEQSNMTEQEIPYRSGDEKEYYDDNMNFYKESIEAYTNLYSWYSFPVELIKNKTSEINISYNTYYYYNENFISKDKSIIDIEDPALKYEYTSDINSSHGISEKIFTFNLFTSYSNDEKTVKDTFIKINSHIINQNYLKLMPINFKKSNIAYYWKYRNLKANPINNITGSILPSYSDKSLSLNVFDIKPMKKNNASENFYEINKKTGFLLMSTRNVNINPEHIKEIRILPGYFKTKDSVKNANKPLEFEISFSNKEDFSDAIKSVKKIKEKDFYNLINKRSYITIFKGKPIEAKFIKIRFLKTSDDNNDIVKIYDIELLKE